jgi:hypothetical protein
LYALKKTIIELLVCFKKTNKCIAYDSVYKPCSARWHTFYIYSVI